CWKNMKNKNSNFEDETGISKKMLSILLKFENFRDSLTFLCNQSFKHGIVPKFLKVTRITPVPKTKHPNALNQYRPIGVNPVLMSILEKLYYNQLIHHIDNTHILTDCQFGARQNHSTADALIAMLDIVKTKL